MSAFNKVLEHYSNKIKKESPERPKVVFVNRKSTPVTALHGRKRKLGAIDFQDVHLPSKATSMASASGNQEEGTSQTNSPYRIVVLPGMQVKGSLSDSDQLNTSTEETPSIHQNRKLVKLTKPLFKQLSEKAKNLVLDCVISVADQDDLKNMKLNTREELLNQDEWNRVASVLVELLHSHFSENDEDEIDFAAIREARVALKDTYSWAGYVTNNFNPIEYVKNISDDGVYLLLRRKNNTKKSNDKRIDLNKRTLNVQTGLNGKTKRRTADSYGVLTPLDFSKEERSKLEHRNYMVHCEKLSKIDEGEHISDEIIQESKRYLKFFVEDMRNARPDSYEYLCQSNVFAFIKHFQIYECVVEIITNRKNMLKDFEHQCAMYLHSLEDLLKAFPILIKGAESSLDFEKSPYMSLATVINLQLGREPRFLLNESDLNEETAALHRPIYLVQRGDLYDMWVQKTLIIGSLTERHALFVFATIGDVLGVSLRKHVNNTDILDFLRKFIINLPDFVICRKQVEVLGHGFFHYAYRQVLQQVGTSSISLPIGVKSAKTAIMLL